LPFHDDFKNPIKRLPKGSKILELACGLRCEGIEFARNQMIVYETDISEEAVNKAKNTYRNLNISEFGKFLTCDAENLPFEDNFFDAVLIAASFHHLPNPEKAMAEMKRVAKSGGYVILGLEPNAWPYYTIFKILLPIKKFIRRRDQKILNSIADDETFGFNKNSFKKLCKQADLKIINIKRAKYLSEIYDSWLRLYSKLTKTNQEPNRKTQLMLCRIDTLISKIPILDLLNWHWSVISQKK